MKCYVIDGQPWFRSKDAATILEYANTIKAISNNVHEDDRKKLEELNLALDNISVNFKYPWTIRPSKLYILMNQVCAL